MVESEGRTYRRNRRVVRLDKYSSQAALALEQEELEEHDQTSSSPTEPNLEQTPNANKSDMEEDAGCEPSKGRDDPNVWTEMKTRLIRRPKRYREQQE